MLNVPTTMVLDSAYNMEISQRKLSQRVNLISNKVMKANELMIGDWIEPHQCRIPTVYARVEGIYPDGITIDKAERVFSFDEIHPIPLTPEILEKNGFEKKDMTMPRIEGQHEWVYWQNMDTCVCLWTRELHDDPKEGWMLRIERPGKNLTIAIQKIHELQHALRLCGIEKEIEL